MVCGGGWDGCGGCCPGADTSPLVPYRVVDDAIPRSLTGVPGDPARGRALAIDRSKGNCVTCHHHAGGR